MTVCDIVIKVGHQWGTLVQLHFMIRSFTSYSTGTVNILNELIVWVIYMVRLNMNGVDSK